ncbi:unnamed protein product [Lactuca virosa]|uniref:Uncharacterized protein n=1 Tax=Lactuca virosa TaxID=75947 RepID=A0AAU9NQ56_9ASTR|nr:unnamed protein product [Lactuca virosa]
MWVAASAIVVASDRCRFLDSRHFLDRRRCILNRRRFLYRQNFLDRYRFLDRRHFLDRRRCILNLTVRRMGRRKRLCITSTDIPIDSEIHDQSSEFSATDIPTEGDQSGHAQTTEGGQSTAEEHSSTEGGAQKKVRGYTQKTETWSMTSSQKIVVTFNRFGKPVGDEGNELVQ